MLWMHSPAHRHVILMASLHRVGLGVATGSFAGADDAVMTTADFLLQCHLRCRPRFAPGRRAPRRPSQSGLCPPSCSTVSPRACAGRVPRTGMSEAAVVAILERNGIPLSVAALRRAESSGEIPLALAVCLADIYGTTTDGLAGRRLHCKRLSLDDFPTQ